MRVWIETDQGFLFVRKTLAECECSAREVEMPDDEAIAMIETTDRYTAMLRELAARGY